MTTYCDTISYANKNEYVEALQGVSPGDAQHLKDAFNVKTVRDLGTNKYFLWAQAVAKLAD
ncbi:hypothetical protein [Williamsia sp. DF01-3]|uniref:hypothetical protein n=1 Tax=Williamsia sp. DF01-3 TaxID=2934157 RepID=UPI000DB4C504|nr:hypothetical protein [Williamsia sp. DF01-3]PZU00025.1 MAG: hypothetical protein DI630_15535 [Gordonia sp. (in: high G+C Gram-positive bacteria)]